MNQKHIQKTHFLQHDQSDCGVACLLSLIKYYYGNQSLEKLRELSGTSTQGTSLLGLYQASIQLGFSANGCEADMMALMEHGEPVILHVTIDHQMEHYVVCYGFQNDKFIIGDPAKGIYELTAEKLNSIWLSKTCLTLQPNENFVVEKNYNQSKWVWFKSLLKEDYKLLGFSVLLGIFMAGLGMAMSIFSQKLIDEILPSHNTKKLVGGTILLAILLLARVVISSLREYILTIQSKNFNERINNFYFSTLLQLPKPFFDTRKIGDLVARLNDTQRVQRVIKYIIGNVVIDVLIALISIIFLFTYSWKMGIICLFSLPIYFVIIYSKNKNIIKNQEEMMQGYGITESYYISTIQGISTIKNHNAEGNFTTINQNLFSKYQDKIFDSNKLNINLSWQSGVSSVIFIIAILGFASYEVFQKHILLGELMAILGIAGGLLPSIANLALVSIPLNEAKIAFNRMFEYANLEKEKKSGQYLNSIQSLQIKDLNFRFAGRTSLLENININIEKGKISAIIGESGCGKSTLGQILQGFYPYESGEIVINNQLNFQEIDIESYRHLIGVIPQDVAIFNGNIVDNIILGEPFEKDRILGFLQTYGFEDYFNHFPQGLATIVGEGGINLSGGQKQMIALARALFRKPQLLILDEATSAMDRHTENFTFNILQRIKPHCAIFFISHKLHSLKKYADEIYILENKTITIYGNHDLLMETENFYSGYFEKI